MPVHDPFPTLRDVLHRSQDQGWLVLSPSMTVPRFVALADLEMAPLLRHLAHRLITEGVPAEAVVELDAVEPWLGLFLNPEWSWGLFIQPFTLTQMRLTLRHASDPLAETSHPLHYRQFTPARFAYVLERAVERLLIAPEPPL